MSMVKSRAFVLIVLALAAAGFPGCKQSGTLSTITVTPARAVFVQGSSQQFKATATFTDGSSLDWTSASEWSSSNTSSVTISNAVGSAGLASALTSAMTVTVTATDTVNNISGTAVLTVTETPLVYIDVTPRNDTLHAGATQQFSAKGTYADGTTQPLTDVVAWSSSNTAVATVSNTAGSLGLVTAIAAGYTWITATDPVTNATDSTLFWVVE